MKRDDPKIKENQDRVVCERLRNTKIRRRFTNQEAYKRRSDTMTSSDGYYPGEIPENVRATIPNFRTPIMINRNYTPDQRGQDIRDEDVLRPSNHKWTGPGEINNMRVRSTDRCPTYGSCLKCFRSGPYGRLCNNCNRDNVTLNKNGLHYVILLSLIHI